MGGGFTDLQLESNGPSLSLVLIHTCREAFLPCDSFNRPRLYEPREGHPWVKGQTNFLSDLQAEQGWWRCSKNVQHKFSGATRPCSLQRQMGLGQRVLTLNRSVAAFTIWIYSQNGYKGCSLSGKCMLGIIRAWVFCMLTL